MYSQTILVGRLGHDPEFKQTSNGDSQCKLSIATSGKWIDQDGVKQEKTTWHSVIVWNKLAELCRDNLVKGKTVFIEGEITNSSWTDDSGSKHYSSEIKAKRILFFDSYKFSNQ